MIDHQPTTMTADSIFEASVHRIGRITIMTCMLFALCIPVFVAILFGIMPPTKNLISGIITVSSFMIPLSIAEILAFYPILGDGGLYIAYTTGNISSLKLPCAAIGMEAAEVKPATPEGKIISIIAMSGSVIVCELLLVIAVILLVPLTGYLNTPLLKPAFEQILPALFGALGAYFILKNYRLAIIPFGLGVVFSLFHVPTAVAVPVSVLIAILGAKILYKKGLVKA